MAYAANTPTGFDQWSVDDVKTWIMSWKAQFNVPPSTISNIISKIGLYNIDGVTLLYLTKDDLKDFGLNVPDINIFLERISHLHKHPFDHKKGKESISKPIISNKENQNDDNKDNNTNNMNTASFTEGYLSTKGQQVYICLQRGNNYTKMAVDSSCTVHQLKLKYLEKVKQKGNNEKFAHDIVLLFMGKVLNEKNTLDYYKIGYTNVSTIFIAERINTTSNDSKGECAGILFINNDDKSEHILYVDTRMTLRELKKIYKNYLVKKYERNMMKEKVKKLYSRSVLFECSGKKFAADNVLLKDCGIGMNELQYIFVSFSNICEEEKDTDNSYITKVYQMTPKEHKQIISIKQKFDESIKSPSFQKTVQKITKTFKATSKHELDQLKSYPQIQDIIKEQTSEDTKKATHYTKTVLNTAPTGKLGSDINTTLHIISNIFKSAGDECVFYDSRQGVKLKAGDSGCAMHEVFVEDKPFVLRLKSLNGLYGVSNDDIKDDKNKLIEMQCAIDNNIQHPTLTHVKSKLSAALGVTMDRINIIQTFCGSDCFKYTVSNLTFPDKQRMIQSDPTGRLARQFREFKELKIHPLLFRPAFDVANFDKRGDKSFVSSNGKYQIGPLNMKKEYIQPTGWTRYGLKVLGKYNDDKWLHPFNDANNWWRAFHGTKRAAVYNVDPADAMANIHQNGFLPAQRRAYGPGVYCSPKPVTAEGYAKQIAMNIRDNGQQSQKNFKFMLQVAVKAGANTLTPQSNDNVWSVQNPHDIRAYGILIKEV